MAKSKTKNLKAVFDEAVKAERFSEPKLHARTESLRAMPHAAKLTEILQTFLSPAEIETIHRRLTRAAFLIEPVNDDVTSTKYDVRWSERLEPDPRGSSFEVCLAIHEALVKKLVGLLADETFRAEVQLILAWGRSPHEFPIDYVSKTAVPIHTVNNVRLLRDPAYQRLLGVRRALLDPKLNPDGQLFEAIFEKVRVKSYLTDRAQTGNYQTNREKRWEAHPQSPQFALRGECFAVELELIDQLFRFQSFPPGIVRYLQSEKLLGDFGKVARCPVTLDPLDFEVLFDEAANPIHGKSAYQVGHMNPLKAGEGAEFRHHRANISWITADGNRIQGHLTLKETRQLLLRISANYDALLKSGEITAP
jgi:hypothetical protein